MLSHINALGVPGAQIALLKAVEAISDSAKAQMLLPTIQMLLSASATEANSQLAELADIVVSCFDISVTNDLNDEHNPLWDTFVSVLRSTFESGHLNLWLSWSGADESTGLLSSSRKIISQSLEHRLFAKLSLERKIAICETLLESSFNDAETVGSLLDDDILISFNIFLALRLQTSSKQPCSGSTPHCAYARFPAT